MGAYGKARLALVVLVAGLMGMAGCNSATPTQVEAGGPSVDGGSETPPPPLPNPFGDVQLWSHPNKLLPHLKSNPNDWTEVAQVVEVFGMFVGAVGGAGAPVGLYADDLAPLQATGRAVALEVGGLRPFACTGQKAANSDGKAIQQIAAAGFSTLYLRMDNPFTFVLEGAYHENPCQHSIQSAVTELIAYMKAVKAEHTGLEIHFGWDEAAYLHQWPGFAPSNPNFDGGNFKEMVTALLSQSAAAGVPVEFFHLDGSLNTHLAYEWNQRGDPWARLKELHDHVKSFDVRFGVLLNFQQPCPGGCGTHASGATAEEFVKRTLTYYDCLVEHDIVLDDVVPESWWNQPSNYFPLTSDDTFGFLTMALAERIENPALVRPCPSAEFNGKWVFSDD